MELIQTKTGSLAYAVHGDGPPLVLLRGLGRSVRHWLGYEQMLARDCQVITIDLRGVGETTVPAGWGLSVFDMADDVTQVLDHLGIESAHVMGVSLGGMVTLAVGLAHPERCRSLVTVNTSIGGTLTPRITGHAVAALARAAVTRGDAFHAKLVDVLVGDDCPGDRRAEIARQYAAIAKEDGLYADVVVRQLVAAGRFLPKRRLQALKVPTLVVYGTCDRFVPNLNSRLLARYLREVKVVPIRGGGHELSLDKPAELAAEVRSWIASQEHHQARA